MGRSHKSYLVKERMCVCKPREKRSHNTEYNSEHCHRCHRPEVLDDEMRAIKPFLWEIAEESMKQGHYIPWNKTKRSTCKKKTNIHLWIQKLYIVSTYGG